MLRRIRYRSAATAFVFAGCWFVLGLLALFSPIPDGLGIWRELFFAWAVLFFIVLAVAGASLTIAAFNGLFPPPERRGPPSARRPQLPQQPAGQRTATAVAPAPDAPERPMPWTGPALPDRAPRRPRPSAPPRRATDDGRTR